MKPPLLLLPIAVALVAGCTIPGTNFSFPWPFGNTISLENDVVVIKELSAIPPTATAPQQIRLIAVIQNQGERHISATTEGSQSTVGTIGASNTVKVELFDYCQGLFKEVKVDPNTCGGSDAQPLGDKGCEIRSLLPKETREVVWTLTPDEDIKLITRCDLKVSVTYPYVTSGLTTVHFINSQEYSRQLAAGGVTARTSTTTQGEGPVKAWYEIKDRQPIVAASGTGTPTPVPVVLHIQNKGTGFLTPLPSKIKPAVKMEDTTKSIFDNPFTITEQNSCTFKEDSEIELIENKRDLQCFIKQLPDCASGSGTGCVAKETTHQLTVDIAYLYEFRKEVKVTVEPPPRI